MKSPLIPHGAGKGDKPRPVNKQAYDRNYDSIFRSKDRRKDQGQAPQDVPGAEQESEMPRPAGRPRDQYHRRLGPDGQTLFIVAH